MAQAINLNLNVQMVGGPSSSAASSLSVDAIEKIELVIPGTAPGKASAAVQPAAAKVKFLLISADKYSDKVTYDVVPTTGTGGAAGVKLDSQQLLVGEGAVGLLGAAPNKLEFSNTLGAGNDVSVTILVGRNAV
jgi:hypothetical protein